MNSQRLRILQGGFLAVLLLCVLLFFYMAIGIPNGMTMWADKQWADEQIQGAQTLEQLRIVAHSAASGIRNGQHICGVLLKVFMLATICLMIFLGWSLFMIRRIKREASTDA